MKQIGEIIEGHPLFHVSPAASVRDAARTMSEHKIGAIAVLDAGKLVGIFSERDVLTRIVSDGRNPDETRVESVMTKEIIVAAPSDHINEALQLPPPPGRARREPRRHDLDPRPAAGRRRCQPRPSDVPPRAGDVLAGLRDVASLICVPSALSADKVIRRLRR